VAPGRAGVGRRGRVLVVTRSVGGADLDVDLDLDL
jgi:hypothetical protein